MVMQNAGGEEGGYSKQVWGFWSGDCGDRCSILNRLKTIDLYSSNA